MMVSRDSGWLPGVLMAAIGLLMASGCGSSPAPEPGGAAAPVASIPAPASDDRAGSASPTIPSAMLRESNYQVPTAPAPRRHLFPEVLIKTSLGDIKLRLNAEVAPATVDNFLDNYVDRRFYSNTVFHHVEPSFIVAGGYGSDLQAKPVLSPVVNEAQNGLKNRRGTVAMARAPDDRDSATSQFYINLADAPELDYDAPSGRDGYCVFGEVIEGLEVAEQIAASATSVAGDFPHMPVEAVVIISIERLWSP